MCYNDNGDSMYEYIKGMITEIETTHIVVETGGIGYLVYVPNPYSFSLNKEEKVYVYQQVREDELSLYGFHTKEEKDLFLKLIAVKGLGCKMALPILASNVSGVIDAIERENILYLKKFPKIGDKVARQIILDLKGKLVETNQNVNTLDSFSELTLALNSLGYKSADIKKILPNIQVDLDIQTQIKEALKLLLK